MVNLANKRVFLKYKICKQFETDLWGIFYRKQRLRKFRLKIIAYLLTKSIIFDRKNFLFFLKKFFAVNKFKLFPFLNKKRFNNIKSNRFNYNSKKLNTYNKQTNKLHNVIKKRKLFLRKFSLNYYRKNLLKYIYFQFKNLHYKIYKKYWNFDQKEDDFLFTPFTDSEIEALKQKNIDVSKMYVSRWKQVRKDKPRLILKDLFKSWNSQEKDINFLSFSKVEYFLCYFKSSLIRYLIFKNKVKDKKKLTNLNLSKSKQYSKILTYLNNLLVYKKSYKSRLQNVLKNYNINKLTNGNNSLNVINNIVLNYNFGLNKNNIKVNKINNKVNKINNNCKNSFFYFNILNQIKLNYIVNKLIFSKINKNNLNLEKINNIYNISLLKQLIYTNNINNVVNLSNKLANKYLLNNIKNFKIINFKIFNINKNYLSNLNKISLINNKLFMNLNNFFATFTDLNLNFSFQNYLYNNNLIFINFKNVNLNNNNKPFSDILNNKYFFSKLLLNYYNIQNKHSLNKNLNFIYFIKNNIFNSYLNSLGIYVNHFNKTIYFDLYNLNNKYKKLLKFNNFYRIFINQKSKNIINLNYNKSIKKENFYINQSLLNLRLNNTHKILKTNYNWNFYKSYFRNFSSNYINNKFNKNFKKTLLNKNLNNKILLFKKFKFNLNLKGSNKLSNFILKNIKFNNNINLKKLNKLNYIFNKKAVLKYNTLGNLKWNFNNNLRNIKKVGDLWIFKKYYFKKFSILTRNLNLENNNRTWNNSSFNSINSLSNNTLSIKFYQILLKKKYLNFYFINKLNANRVNLNKIIIKNLIKNKIKYFIISKIRLFKKKKSYLLLKFNQLLNNNNVVYKKLIFLSNNNYSNIKHLHELKKLYFLNIKKIKFILFEVQILYKENNLNKILFNKLFKLIIKKILSNFNYLLSFNEVDKYNLINLSAIKSQPKLFKFNKNKKFTKNYKNKLNKSKPYNNRPRKSNDVYKSISEILKENKLLLKENKINLYKKNLKYRKNKFWTYLNSSINQNSVFIKYRNPFYKKKSYFFSLKLITKISSNLKRKNPNRFKTSFAYRKDKYWKFRKFYGNLTNYELKKLCQKSYRLRGNIVINFMLLLETRLDTVLYRTGMVSSIFEARQLISHKKVCVNKKIVNIKSYNLNINELVSFIPQIEPKLKRNLLFRIYSKSLIFYSTPYIEINYKLLTAMFLYNIFKIENIQYNFNFNVQDINTILYYYY